MLIRVLIADDHPLFRAGVRNELAGQEGIEVIGEAMDGDEAIRMTEELGPDVLLLDVHMPGMKATQIVSRLQRTAQATRVVILSAYDDAATVLGMLRAGAKGYVVKDEEPGAVVEAVRVVMQDKTWLSSAVAAVVTESMVAEGRPEANEPVLTGRELEVLQLLGQGHNSDQIGEELYISRRTVEYHIDRIMAKLHAHNRTEAYAIAVKNGWIHS